MISVKKNSDASKYMKTLLMWQEVNDGELTPKFLDLTGDFSRFHNVFVNQWTDKDEIGVDEHKRIENLQQELNDFMYDLEGKPRHKFLSEPTRDWSIFVHCGFIY